MKSRVIPKIAAIAVFLLAFMAIPSRVSAQSTTCGSYIIKNNLNCPAVVNYVRTCNGATCGSGTQTIPPMGFITLPPCACPNGNCDVKTTLLSVGGNPITPAPSVSATHMSAPYSTSCAGAMGSLNWDSMITAIN